MQKIWDKYLDPRDRKVYSTAGFGRQTQLGKKPALIIVDVTYGFAGDRSVPIEESLNQYPTSCGEASWEAIGHIQKLLEVARELHIPVFHTIIEGSKNFTNENVAVKGNIFNHHSLLEGEKGTWIVDELKPVAGEVVISKKKPSAFFGTPLTSYLTTENIDTVIIAGTTTSGCIRSTVIDAFSYNYRVFVPEECVFDRGIASHAINLFDMQQKYADVVETDELINQIKANLS